MMNKIRDQTASIILSSLSFLIVMSLMLAGLSVVIKNEAQQAEMLSNNYIAKAMISLSVQLINETASDDINGFGRVTFNHGQVQVERIKDNQIRLTATLTNDYTFSQIHYLNQVKEDKEIDNPSSDEPTNQSSESSAPLNQDKKPSTQTSESIDKDVKRGSATENQADGSEIDD